MVVHTDHQLTPDAGGMQVRRDLEDFVLAELPIRPGVLLKRHPDVRQYLVQQLFFWFRQLGARPTRPPENDGRLDALVVRVRADPQLESRLPLFQPGVVGTRDPAADRALGVECRTNFTREGQRDLVDVT